MNTALHLILIISYILFSDAFILSAVPTFVPQAGQQTQPVRQKSQSLTPLTPANTPVQTSPVIQSPSGQQLAPTAQPTQTLTQPAKSVSTSSTARTITSTVPITSQELRTRPSGDDDFVKVPELI